MKKEVRIQLERWREERQRMKAGGEKETESGWGGISEALQLSCNVTLDSYLFFAWFFTNIKQVERHFSCL